MHPSIDTNLIFTSNQNFALACSLKIVLFYALMRTLNAVLIIFGRGNLRQICTLNFQKYATQVAESGTNKVLKTQASVG